ncbi:hypothetical protein GQ54DRAFT_148714 [Martensiomyces pterosporus]|nr:hypothetical protein GQ54DRAFT_148714 [Martensiomyces pterosporus]
MTRACALGRTALSYMLQGIQCAQAALTLSFHCLSTQRPLEENRKRAQVHQPMRSRSATCFSFHIVLSSPCFAFPLAWTYNDGAASGLAEKAKNNARKAHSGANNSALPYAPQSSTKQAASCSYGVYAHTVCLHSSALRAHLGRWLRNDRLIKIKTPAAMPSSIWPFLSRVSSGKHRSMRTSAAVSRVDSVLPSCRFDHDVFLQGVPDSTLSAPPGTKCPEHR